MITIKTNQSGFYYDIHSLVRAFYPATLVAFEGEKKFNEEPSLLHIEITFSDTQIKAAFYHVMGQEEPFLTQNVTVDQTDRKETKNRLKKLLYDMLKEYTKKELPWGTLSGIRPIKIPLKQMEAGASEEEIADYMRKNYYCSEQKIQLSTQIAKREYALLQKLDYEHGYSLYIGIPFCPSTCLYCSFTSFPLSAWKDRVDEYLDALEKEIDFTAAKFYHKKLNTIYIGGGTPTTLSPAQMDRLMRKIKCSFDLSNLLEFTVEAGRPDSITREKLCVLRKHHITRISINPQTMQDKTLKVLGRNHSVAAIKETYHIAREMGFDNINMDLIMGLPGETLEDVMDTLKEIMILNPDNLTVHSLALKRAARLNMFRDEYKDYKMEDTTEHIKAADEAAHHMQMSPYYLYRQQNMAGNLENVGYAKENKAGIYNILIMEEKQTIMALGAGAATKFVCGQGKKTARAENVKDIDNYIDRIDEMIQRKQEIMEEISWL